jgi:hypothetical protein
VKRKTLIGAIPFKTKNLGDLFIYLVCVEVRLQSVKSCGGISENGTPTGYH